MKRGKIHRPPCTLGFPAASVSEHQRAVLDLRHGKHLSFRKGRSSLCFELLRLTLTISGLRNPGRAIGIPCVVVVRVAVRVHIAEVVAVVVIRGTLPPISSGTRKCEKTHPPTGFTEMHPYFHYFLPLSLFSTFVNNPFSRSINSPSSCAICSNFFLASEDLTLLPLPVVKHPDGFVIISS